MGAAPMDPRAEALRHLEEARESDDPRVRVAVAAVYALLDVADAIKHGLRDVIYELRD